MAFSIPGVGSTQVLSGSESGGGGADFGVRGLHQSSENPATGGGGDGTQGKTGSSNAKAFKVAGFTLLARLK